MQRLNAASCLFLAFLGIGVCEAAERVDVQVVQTHSGITLGPGSDETAAIWSYCDGTSGHYRRELGFYCGDSAAASLAPMRMSEDLSFFFDVRVVMPDSARIVYHCSTILNNDCEGFPEYPQKTAVSCLDFVSSGRTYKDCTAKGSDSAGIGVYRAALHGDRMTIFGPNWHRHYLQYGIWQLNAAAAQDSKPAPAQEPTPAPRTDPKPATPPDSNPAAAPDPKPAPPSDSTPATPDPKPTPPPETDPAVPSTADPSASEIGTDESKSDTPPVPRLTSALTTNPVIDPRVIEQAKAGDPESQYKLGYYYFQGKGVPIDYVQAAIWWRKAADQGLPQAQNNLGVLYNAGKGVPQSYAEAYFWQNLAASRANGPLQVTFAKNRDESAAKLWLLSRLKVQQRAAKWAADHPVAPRAHEPLPEEKHSQTP